MMNRVDALNLAIAALNDNAEAVEILEKMKASAERQEEKNAEKREANNIIKTELLAFLGRQTEAVECKTVATATGYSSSKCSSLMRQLEDECKVVINREGKTNTYKAA